VEAQPADAPGALQEYGAERLCRLAAEYYGRPPQELIDGVNADVRAFCEPEAPHDDVTMIAVRYRP
jgi:serine phosphatase RsbU (regulator of sigma subunit)